ncbi:MAG: hypothetical protein UW39_C0036G0003 [Parcubacteria group bacterium GW2011_GWC2_44_17]|nr:MAG: hypothetical protein UW39_C0036G0003 [Parcubacteria group bacterium GW2011_GWC2_44_17]
MINKIKGIGLILSGLCWILFVYNFDALVLSRPRAFGVKAFICFAAGLIALINGLRIILRK